MRKLKLQMQMSIDGFVAGPDGELDWMTWEWDKELEKYVDELTNSIDTILLGRKMTGGFVSHWTNVLNNPSDPSFAAAKIFISTPKIVFSRNLGKSEWENTELVNGDSVEFIRQLKQKPGKDIIVYGGAGFVSSLVIDNLIDEYYLFVNPSVIGKGMRIFSEVEGIMNFKIADSRKFECGIVLNCYIPN